MANSKIPPSNSRRSPRVAIVHDWLTNMGGAERVVLALHEAFPDAPIYTSVYEPDKVPLFAGLDVRTTWLQRLPRPLRSLHKLFPVLRVFAFRALDMGFYDVVISSSSAEAKQVRIRKGAKHICYCHTPIRYYWSHYDEYKKNPGFGRLNWLIRLLLPLLAPAMRRYDFDAAQKVDLFIANSREVQKRIKRYYHKDSVVIHPPVDFDRFAPHSQPVPKRTGYITLGRQVPYKRHDLAVQACTQLNLPLVVIGNGSEHERLKRLAGPTVKFVKADDQEVARLMGSAKGFIFPAEEDFGIVQVEALAAGTPVIAYGKGGALDIVEDGKTGLLFQQQTVTSLVEALEKAEKSSFVPATLQTVARRFSVSAFIGKIKEAVL